MSGGEGRVPGTVDSTLREVGVACEQEAHR